MNGYIYEWTWDLKLNFEVARQRNLLLLLPMSTVHFPPLILSRFLASLKTDSRHYGSFGPLRFASHRIALCSLCVGAPLYGASLWHSSLARAGVRKLARCVWRAACVNTRKERNPTHSKPHTKQTVRQPVSQPVNKNIIIIVSSSSRLRARGSTGR